MAGFVSTISAAEAQGLSAIALDTLGLAIVATFSTAYLLRPWEKTDPHRHKLFEKVFPDGDDQSQTSASRDISKQAAGKQAVIFWGSQSGTAQSLATRLQRELLGRFGLDALSADLSDYDAETISRLPASTVCIFIVATFGEGDPSDNALGFVDYLHKASPSLGHLEYAAFGLGNSNYQHYNRVVDVVASKLDSFGARALMPVRKGDDAQDATEEHFLGWKDELLALLKQKLSLEEKAPTYTPRLDVVDDESLDLADLYLGSHSDGAETAVELPIAASRPLSSHGTQRNASHIEFDLSAVPTLRYKTGDYLLVWPANPDAEVDRLLRVLGAAPARNTPMLVRPTRTGAGEIKVPVPSPTTRDALFRHYLEICAPVSVDTVAALAQFAPSPEARAFCERLAADRGAYAAFAAENHVTLARLMEHAAVSGGGGPATWSGMPLAFIVENVAPLKPRWYSISSSSVIAPRRPSITTVAVHSPLAGKPEVSVPGLASNFLDAAAATAQQLSRRTDGRIALSLRKSRFHPPSTPAAPLIMVAAGTGIAPFRAFLQERARLAGMGVRPVGPTLLFFGCRAPADDYLYREELEAAEASLREAGVRAEIIPAFSRFPDRDGRRPGRYVQDALRERGDVVAELVVDQDARVYVCGRAAMGREACRALRAAVRARTGWDEEECLKWWERWRRSGGFAEDVWG